MNDKKLQFVVDAPILQALVDYLVTRPYKEVARYLEALKGLEAGYVTEFVTEKSKQEVTPESKAS
jgi:hypothetical protein